MQNRRKGRLEVVVAALAVCLALTVSAGAAEEPAGERERVLSSWTEVVKLEDRTETRRVEILYDYDAGQGHRRVLDASGRVLESVPLVENLPQPTPEEIAEAVELARADPDVGPLVAAAVPDGGFLLEEEQGECARGSRCLQLLWVDSERLRLVQWTVVDLVRRDVVYAADRVAQGAQR